MIRRVRFVVIAITVIVATLLTQALAQPATTIDLEIGSGPHQGTYQATSQDVTCTYGYAGEGVWGNQYSIDASDPNDFSSLQLVVDTVAAAEGTGEFLATVSFGQFFTPQETSYNVDTRSGSEGSGTVTVEDRGDSGTVTISAVTADGIPFEATIECHKVLRAGPSVADLAAEEAAESAPAGPLNLTLNGQSFELLPSSEEAYCAEALSESNDFQYSYYPLEYEGAAITGVEVYLYDTRALGDGAELYLSISTTDNSYYIDTSEGVDDGSGTVSLRSNGARRNVEVSAVTSDGIPLRVELECRAES